MSRLEIDPEWRGLLVLSTLNADTLSFDSSSNTQTYGWNINDWSVVLDNPEQGSEKYVVRHEFMPNFCYAPSGFTPAANNSTVVAPTGWGIFPVNGSIALMSNLSGDSVASFPNVASYNGGANSILTYLTRTMFRIAGSGGNFYFGMRDTTPPFDFVCSNPRSVSRLIIRTFPQLTGQNSTAATNTMTTSGDFYSSGIHFFTFRKLRPLLKIYRRLSSQVIGTLTVSTVLSNSQSFVQSLGQQTYVWNNIQWWQIIGGNTSCKWEVTHEFLPNCIAGFSDGTNGNQSSSQPYTPAFMIGCNLRTSTLTPNGPGNQTINMIASSYVIGPTAVSNGGIWGCSTLKAPKKFITSAPESNSNLVITTTATQQTLTQGFSAPGPFYAVNAFPNDFYTNGVHRFTFILLE